MNIAFGTCTGIVVCTGTVAMRDGQGQSALLTIRQSSALWSGSGAADTCDVNENSLANPDGTPKMQFTSLESPIPPRHAFSPLANHLIQPLKPHPSSKHALTLPVLRVCVLTVAPMIR